MFERFTSQARDIVHGARVESERLGNRHIGTEHLLLAMLETDAGTASALLRSAGLTADGVRAEIAHILGPTGIIGEADAAALESIGIDIQAVRAKLEESFGPGALQPEVPPTRYGLFGRRLSGGPFTPRAKKVLELSLREALRLHDNHIGAEHLLLGLLREGQGLAAQIMARAQVDFIALRASVERTLRAAA